MQWLIVGGSPVKYNGQHMLRKMATHAYVIVYLKLFA